MCKFHIGYDSWELDYHMLPKEFHPLFLVVGMEHWPQDLRQMDSFFQVGVDPFLCFVTFDGSNLNECLCLFGGLVWCTGIVGHCCKGPSFNIDKGNSQGCGVRYSTLSLLLSTAHQVQWCWLISREAASYQSKVMCSTNWGIRGEARGACMHRHTTGWAADSCDGPSGVCKLLAIWKTVSNAQEATA